MVRSGPLNPCLSLSNCGKESVPFVCHKMRLKEITNSHLYQLLFHAAVALCIIKSEIEMCVTCYITYFLWMRRKTRQNPIKRSLLFDYSVNDSKFRNFEP